LALAGCALATASQPSAPTTRPGGVASTSAPPRIGAPEAADKSSLGGFDVIRAGSYPRSFLTPGTDTSIRIGG